MADDDFDPNEILVKPIGDMVSMVGLSIAQASRDMMEAQLEAMEDMPERMAKYGMQPTLYHMQSVQVDLQMAIHLSETEEYDPKAKDGWLKRFGKMITGAPINNGYTKGETFDVRGASQLRMQFAPGPPPERQEGTDGS